MVRKISLAILSVAILVIGVMAFCKLNYWESSVWIFKLNSGQHAEVGTDHGQVDGRGNGGFRDERRHFPDSLSREFSQGFSGRSERSPNDAGFRQRGGRGRGDFRGGKKINLGNVLWYLAVFASFTVTAIYIDNWLRLIRKSKKPDQCQ